MQTLLLPTLETNAVHGGLTVPPAPHHHELACRRQFQRTKKGKPKEREAGFPNPWRKTSFWVLSGLRAS